MLRRLKSNFTSEETILSESHWPLIFVADACPNVPRSENVDIVKHTPIARKPTVIRFGAAADIALPSKMISCCGLKHRDRRKKARYVQTVAHFSNRLPHQPTMSRKWQPVFC